MQLASTPLVVQSFGMARITTHHRVKRPGSAQRTETVPFTGGQVNLPSDVDRSTSGRGLTTATVTFCNALAIGIVGSLQWCFDRAH
jgi:hypothetical protein